MAQIMIIDDDPMVSRFLEEHLAADGYEAKSFAMAEDAFQAAVQAPPDLFIVDVMLPDATGFQMVGRFRQHPKTRDIPIIMMSGTARHANQKEIGKGMGADDYLVKPIDSEMVSKKIHQLLASRPKRQPASLISPVVPESVHEVPIDEVATPNLSELPTPVTSDVPQNGDGKDFHLPEFEYGDTQEPEKFTQPKVFEEPREQRFAISPKTSWVVGLLVLHMALAIVLAWRMSHPSLSAITRVASAIAAGWVLLLGLLVAACAISGIIISTGEAFSLLVWPALPIIARSAAALAGFKLDPQFATPVFYWIRPLDVFEMAAILMLGISLRRKPGSSLGNAILVCLVIALGWCLTNRGYFQP